ncbi:MAG: iron ABC transporter permease [Deltaproteobacteria bacterium]|nr:iron ABC transporter permease [Deltaproteobacteria bacterium]
MNLPTPHLVWRLVRVSLGLGALLVVSLVAGLLWGSSRTDWLLCLKALVGVGPADDLLPVIIWQIRFPRALLAALVGSALSLGGLVFQALLHNPLAEPYILGISGGAAVGAIIGILLGLAPFPGVAGLAFLGSMAVMGVVVFLTPRQTGGSRDALLLSGVMVNALCTALILFFITMTQDARLHNILYWLMGDLSVALPPQIYGLALLLLPCYLAIFLLARPLNLLYLGEEQASYLGLAVPVLTYTLLGLTSLMLSAAVCQAGLVGFVGLVVPHLLRLWLGPEHRILVPACILGGGAYLVGCDLLARVLPSQGELPVGVITALIGAPLFIYLLHRSRA